MKRILHNRIRCKKCGDVIESVCIHDFKWCSCGSCAVDGGTFYIKRAWDGKVNDPKDVFEELTEYTLDLKGEDIYEGEE